MAPPHAPEPQGYAHRTINLEFRSPNRTHSEPAWYSAFRARVQVIKRDGGVSLAPYPKLWAWFDRGLIVSVLDGHREFFMPSVTWRESHDRQLVLRRSARLGQVWMGWPLPGPTPPNNPVDRAAPGQLLSSTVGALVLPAFDGVGWGLALVRRGGFGQPGEVECRSITGKAEPIADLQT
jgi:hypothetical protein